MRELHLRPCTRRRRVPLKHVQDDCLAVGDGQSRDVLEVSGLGRAQFGVDDQKVGARAAGVVRDALGDAATDQRPRVGPMQFVHLGADDTVALGLDQAGHLSELGGRIAPVTMPMNRQDETGVATGCRPSLRRFAARPVRHDRLPAAVVGQRNLSVFFKGLRIELHGPCPLRRASPRRTEHRRALQG